MHREDAICRLANDIFPFFLVYNDTINEAKEE